MPTTVPLHSMTGFGTARRHFVADDGPWSVEVELRSVNARFLELKLRQPFGGKAEPALRRRLEGALGRGRVELSVHLRRGDGAAVGADDPLAGPLAELGIDPARLAATLAAAAQLCAAAKDRQQLEVLPPTAVEVLRFCQSSPKSGPSSERAPAAPPCLDEAVAQALDELLAFRSREGEALDEALATLADELEAKVAALTATLPPEHDRLAERVRTRIEELRTRLGADAVDAQRLAQEVAVLVARGDIAEELARIASHLVQMREVLAAPAAAGQGKTLEFVAQELLREVTTIGSKITSHEGSRIVIEAKGTLERIREQVQNVE